MIVIFYKDVMKQIIYLYDFLIVMKFLFFLNCIEICFGGKKFGGRSGGGVV